MYYGVIKNKGQEDLDQKFQAYQESTRVLNEMYSIRRLGQPSLFNKYNEELRIAPRLFIRIPEVVTECAFPCALTQSSTSCLPYACIFCAFLAAMPAPHPVTWTSRTNACLPLKTTRSGLQNVRPTGIRGSHMTFVLLSPLRSEFAMVLQTLSWRFILFP